MKNFYLAISFIAFLSSCAFHSGNVSSGSIVDCPMKTIITGQASTSKFLGLGGLSKNALIVDAKQDLYRKISVKKNLKLTNFSVDFKTTYILFYSSTIATVSADLFDCSGTEDSSPNADSDNQSMIGGLLPGDSIIYEYNGFHKGLVSKHLSKERCAITFQYNNGRLKKQNVSQNVIFKITEHTSNKNYFGYDIGEKASVEVLNLKTNTKTVKPCTIIGLNENKLLISYNKEDGQERILSVDKSLIRQ
ncbi:hypothetical protein MYP_1416 [Sporocytophaga myxococcoides]|uniref:Lipoprotein n=1 Tax=Sporocytophaga myxococcoides TaxID=153721 RepID=A0A098LCV2_9BACT|nr:DUF6567 family protein [Sporocytophaga myxococcoides]GAL84188.1 hypothetical protein MYP_1416 [Sporocytophaga myxococcoides]